VPFVAGADQGATRVRTIPYQRGISIASRLLEGDQVVLVQREESTEGLIFESEPAVAWYAAYSVGSSHAAVVLNVQGIHGTLADDGSWIYTEVLGTPSRVIFSSIPGVKKAQPMHLHYEHGGELQIGGCTVKAGVLLNLQIGGSYLVFFAWDSAGQFYPTRTIMEIHRGRLVDTWRSIKPVGKREPLDGVSLDRAVKEIQKAARQLTSPR